MSVPRRVIWIASMPRSGSSWLSQVFAADRRLRFRMAPLFSPEFSGSVAPDASDGEWLRFFKEVFISESDFLCQERRRNEGDFPRFGEKVEEESELVIKDVRNHDTVWSLATRGSLPVRIIYLVRDPRAAIYSWMRHPGEFPKGGAAEDWRTGGARKSGEGEFWGFEDWLTVTQNYVELAAKLPDRVEIVRFEDLCQNGADAFEALFARLGLSFEDGPREFLESSWGVSSDRPYSVYRDRSQVIRSWEEGLPREIESAIVAATVDRGFARFLFN